MPVEMILPLGMGFGLLGWGLVFRWYVHPLLAPLNFCDAIRPLLVLHGFRYIGLMFLIPGVTAEPLDPRFTNHAAYGDLLTAVLALLALLALSAPRTLMLSAIALFNTVGFIDLINAVTRGMMYNSVGGLGATFWIPMVIVPMLLVSHVYIFARLYQQFRIPAQGHEQAIGH